MTSEELLGSPVILPAMMSLTPGPVHESHRPDPDAAEERALGSHEGKDRERHNTAGRIEPERQRSPHDEHDLNRLHRQDDRALAEPIGEDTGPLHGHLSPRIKHYFAHYFAGCVPVVAGSAIRAPASFNTCWKSGDSRMSLVAAARRRSTASSERTNDVGN